MELNFVVDKILTTIFRLCGNRNITLIFFQSRDLYPTDLQTANIPHPLHQQSRLRPHCRVCESVGPGRDSHALGPVRDVPEASDVRERFEFGGRFIWESQR